MQQNKVSLRLISLIVAGACLWSAILPPDIAFALQQNIYIPLIYPYN